MSPDHNDAAVQWDPALLGQIDAMIAARLSSGPDPLQRLLQPRTCSAQAPRSTPTERATIVAFSGDMDKLFATFVIATGAAATGMQVSIFFTFWGLNAIRQKALLRGKGLCEKLMALMLPSGPARLGTSKMNLFGAGPTFFRYVMRKRNVLSLPDLVAMAREAGVRLVACQTSMDVMGIRREELIDGVEIGGVATYLADARDSRITLFI